MMTTFSEVPVENEQQRYKNTTEQQAEDHEESTTLSSNGNNTKAKVDTTEFEKFVSPWKNQNEEFMASLRTMNTESMDTEGGDENKVNVKGSMLRRSFNHFDLTQESGDVMTKLRVSNSMAMIQSISTMNNSAVDHDDVRPLKTLRTPMDDSRHLFDSTKEIPNLNESSTCAIITDAELTGWKFVCDSCNSQVFQSYYQNQPVLVKSFDVYRSLEEEETLIDFEFEVDTLAKAKHHHIAKAMARSATINDAYRGGGENNPSIVPFSTTANSSSPPQLHTLFIVMEHVVTTGTLAYALESGLLDSSDKYFFSRLLLFAKDLASAISYMHHDLNRKGPIIHGDLNPDCVGLGNFGRLKLADMGRCKLLTKQSRTLMFNTNRSSNNCHGRGVPSRCYMAPETSSGDGLTEKVDVYSYAMIVWSMLSHREPTGVNIDPKRPGHVDTRTLELPSTWPSELREMLVLCWQIESYKRPSFRKIVSFLERLLHISTVNDHCESKPSRSRSRSPVPLPISEINGGDRQRDSSSGEGSVSRGSSENLSARAWGEREDCVDALERESSVPRLQLSNMNQKQQQHQEQQQQLQQQQHDSSPDSSQTSKEARISFVDKIVSKVTTGVLPMLARISGQGSNSSNNNSPLTTVKNSKIYSGQNSPATLVSTNEPGSTSNSVPSSRNGSVNSAMVPSNLLAHLSHISQQTEMFKPPLSNSGEMTPPEEPSLKPHSRIISRASLTTLSSLVDDSSSPPRKERARVGGEGFTPTNATSATTITTQPPNSMSRSRSRSCFDQPTGHPPLQVPLITTDDGNIASDTSSPSTASQKARKTFPTLMTPRSKKEAGGGVGMSLPPIVIAK